MANDIIRNPTVRLIAIPSIQTQALRKFFEDEGVDFSDDVVSPAKLILQSAESDPAHNQASLLAEIGGRRCYDSWHSGRKPVPYHNNVIEEKHGSVYGHGSYTFTISGVSRSLTHELARHQIGVGFSQQSQRYVKAGDINLVLPPLLVELERRKPAATEPLITEWFAQNYKQIETYEKHRLLYEDMLTEEFPRMLQRHMRKRAAEAARSLLPNAAETRLVWSCNMRAARHIVQMRGSMFADMEIQRLFVDHIYPLLKEHELAIFQDYNYVDVENDLVDCEVSSPIGGI